MPPTAHWIGIALAGAAGVLCRAGVSKLAGSFIGDDFPWGVTIVNVAGSFAFAAIVATSPLKLFPAGAEPLLLVGFLGGFTTFSSFSFETLRLLQAGQTGVALTFFAVNNIGGIAAAWLGLTAFAAHQPH